MKIQKKNTTKQTNEQKTYAFLISHYHRFIKIKVSIKSSHSNWIQLVLGKAHYFVMRHLGHLEMGQISRHLDS